MQHLSYESIKLILKFNIYVKQIVKHFTGKVLYLKQLKMFLLM